MHRSRTITVHFSKDREAAAVHSVLRQLKQNGYTQYFAVFGNYAEVTVSPEEFDTVVSALEDLRYRQGYQEIWIS